MTKLELARQKVEHAFAILDCTRYRELGESLRHFAAANYPAGTVVQVAQPNNSFLQGFSHFPEDDCSPDQLPVTLCNGNTWWYGLDTISVPLRSAWEPWVKREHRNRARQKTLAAKARKSDLPRVAIP